MLKVFLLLFFFSMSNFVLSSETQESALSQLLILSKNNNWTNIEKLTGELAIRCHPDTTKKEVCSDFVNSFYTFVAESRLLIQNKNLISGLVGNVETEYLKSNSLKLLQKKIDEKNAQEKVHVEHTPDNKKREMTPAPSPRSSINLINRSTIISILALLSIAALILAWKILFTIIDNRYLKKFKSQLLASSKKHGINFKLHETVNIQDIKTMKKISHPLNMIINEAKSITNNLELTLEKKNHKLNVEITFLTCKSLDFFSKPNMERKLDKSLLAFQEKILKDGGSLTVVTSFSKVGEIKQTTLIGIF